MKGEKPFKMHKIIFSPKKYNMPTLPKIFQTRYPKHTYFFIWPYIGQHMNSTIT